ncbi:MAG: AAA family ATPase [Bacillota bacterium]
MTTHISARIAWHDDGWNGHICKNPAANTFCVGNHSYPGQYIAENRCLEWENSHAGQYCGQLDRFPPCCYSINAFGSSDIMAESSPPDWFNNETETRQWTIPPATVCIWPYEVMYTEDVRRDGHFDCDRRLQNAREYFGEIESGRSLIFYYSNYSNPFSEDDAKRYVLVGVSRIKSVGEELFYEGCSKQVMESYGGFVWQRNVTSCYPDQGFRIPYHRYRNEPEILNRIALFPDNPRVCKYATRHMSDDDALGLLEGFLRVVYTLREIGDDSEDWERRAEWLEGLIAELWRHRGLLPGTGAVLNVLGMTAAIPYFKQKALDGAEKEAHAEIFSLLAGEVDKIPGLRITPDQCKKARRQWRLRTEQEQNLLRDALPRFDLEAAQIEKILSERRSENGIAAELLEIISNPYTLSEQYSGDDPDDLISWGTIDRGMIPSPELGGESLAELDDPCRFRALLVNELRQENEHTFVPSRHLLSAVNYRLERLPEWKRFQFHERYIEADADELSEALHIRSDGENTYIYLKTVYEDERLIEDKINFLLSGPDIELSSPVTEVNWKSYLYRTDSTLAQKAEEEYRKIIEDQIEACQQVFIRPLSVISGEAGSGKTTVINAIIKAIKKGHGVGTPVIALAPTGKAADRIREVLEGDDAVPGSVEVATIHSFLAQRGWMNPNMTFRRSGGRVEAGYNTYIIDESSMLDLSLIACFFRAVQWPSVQRLIFVGDPNQLPPIGRGRFFADLISHLGAEAPESVAFLKHNLRQMEARLVGSGSGIIDLAKCYLNVPLLEAKDEDADIHAEIMLQKISEGGDISDDLRVLYWNTQEELNHLLLTLIEEDMVRDISSRGNNVSAIEDKPWELWNKAFDEKPDYLQIITPYRGGFFGTEEINRICQQHVRKGILERVGAIDGITLFDKVIQIVNRPSSRKINAYNWCTRQVEGVEVFNGQLGFVRLHPFDRKEMRRPSFRLQRFQVVFARRSHLAVGYGRGLGGSSPNESVEENLELAYALSIHKAQGSDFQRVYVVIPKQKQSMLSTELFYTALTRARKHCTILIEENMLPLIDMRRPEFARLNKINSSLFSFQPVPDDLLDMPRWHEEGLIHQTIAPDVMVRSKSEVIIANMLQERGIPFRYEQPLRAPNGTFYLPDFTVIWRGTEYYWEHLGLLHCDDYRRHWEKKQAWYARFFPGRLIITEESGKLSRDADEVIRSHFS